MVGLEIIRIGSKKDTRDRDILGEIFGTFAKKILRYHVMTF